MENRIRLLTFDKTGEITYKSQPKDEDDRLKMEPEDEKEAPVLGALILTVAWLFACAGLFCVWENWSYFTSFYFFFVSLSTVGEYNIIYFCI